jgi:HK97 family phage portal protein
MFERIKQVLQPLAAVFSGQLTITDADSGWSQLYEGINGRHAYGEGVTPETAMTCAVANRCVMLISGILSALDLCVYRDDPELGQIKATDHPFYPMLTRQPWSKRPYTAYAWKEMQIIENLLQGNAFSVIRTTKAGKIVGFEPVLPTTVVEVRRSTIDQSLNYTVKWDDGRSDELVGSSQMLHFAGPGFDGLLGRSRISYAAPSIALSRTLQTTLGVAHDNAMMPRTVIYVGPDMTPTGYAKLKNTIERKSGFRSAGETITVDGSAKVEQLGINLVDLSIIEAMQATSLEIANAFGVPATMLNIPSGATEWGSGIDSLFRAFQATTLGTEMRRYESELCAKLFPNGGEFYIAFDRSQLLQNDPKTQAEVNSAEVQSAVSTPNEIRRRQHRPIVKGGDEPLVNTAIQPLKKLLEPTPAPTAAPAPANNSPPQPPQGSQPNE